MRNLWVFGLCALFIWSCQEKSNSISEVEFEEKDTLNLPHYPYIDYTKIFEGKKFYRFTLQHDKAIVQRFYKDYWELNDVSGGLLVARNGQIIYENYRGLANIEKNERLTADTPIHIASISKVLTALAVLKLVEEDELKLDQLVSHIFPHFPYKNITIRDLLSHRSGLPNYAYFENDPKYWDFHQMQTNENVLEALIQKVALPFAEPNTMFSYSNTNYALLALVIEKITKLKYPEAMQYIVFDPLQMNHTFVFNIKDSARVSQSYSSRNTRWDFDFLDNIYGDKNIYSTPRDLYKMDQAMYAQKFLSQKLKKLMKQGYSYEKEGVKNYGLGLRLMEWKTGEKVLYHNGWWHGNYTTYVRGEQDSITIIALGNKQIRSVYSSFSLIGNLGDYPVSIEFKDEKLVKAQDSLHVHEDKPTDLNIKTNKSTQLQTKSDSLKEISSQKAAEHPINRLEKANEEHNKSTIIQE